MINRMLKSILYTWIAVGIIVVFIGSGCLAAAHPYLGVPVCITLIGAALGYFDD